MVNELPDVWDEDEEEAEPLWADEPQPQYRAQANPGVQRDGAPLVGVPQYFIQRDPDMVDPLRYEAIERDIDAARPAFPYNGYSHADVLSNPITDEEADEAGLLRVMASKCGECADWVVMCAHGAEKVVLLHTTQWSSAALMPQTFYVCVVKGGGGEYHHDLPNVNECHGAWDRWGYEGAVKVFLRLSEGV